MINICDVCPLQGCEVTEDQLTAGYIKLLLDERTRAKLTSETFSALDTAEARASTDPNVRKTVIGHAIAECVDMHLSERGDCNLSEYGLYANIDAVLPIRL